MKYLIFILLTYSVFRLDANIQYIPEKEFEKIKFFFEKLICEHDFSYTIFGSKPMALADICLWAPETSNYRQFQAQQLLIRKKEGLKAWYKYKNEFKFKDFILLDDEKDLFDCIVFILINKPHMLSLLYTHERIFKEILGDSFNPDSFLEKIEKKETSFAQAIHHHYGLLGIMLGYGVRNSTLYQERHSLLGKIKENNTLINIELQNKLKDLNSKLQPFNKFEEFPLARPLYFGADLTHPETIALKKKYENDRKKIESLMRQPNFIDRALERLQGKEFNS